MFDVRHLRHLIAIADEGTLQRASEKLHITQPALTKSIKTLEESLDARLFERSGRRLRLTDLGREVVAQGRGIVRSMRDTEDLVKAWRAGTSGQVTIGLGPAYSVLLTAELVEVALTDQGPVRLQLETGDSDSLMARLLDDTIHVAVCDLALPPPDPDIVALPLETQAVVGLVREGHPLLALDHRGMNELTRYPLAHSPAPAQFAQVTEGLASMSKHNQGTVCLSDHYDSLVEVAERTDLVTLMPVNLAAKYRETKAVDTFELDLIPQRSAPKILYRRTGKLLPPLAERLIGHIQSIFAEKA